MDNALQIGKSSATDSFNLLIGVALSTIIMAVGTLFIAGLLPASDVGLYGMAIIPATLISYFRDWGVNSALTQYIASLKASGNQSEIHDIVYSGIIFEMISGSILSVICFAIAEPLAYLLSPKDIGSLTLYISIVSISIFAGALINAATGIFVGFQKMKLNSITMIIQAVIKTALGPALIVLGFGVLGALYAYIVSFVAGGAIAIGLVYFIVFRPLRVHKVGKINIKKTLKPMLAYGLPLTISSISLGVLAQIFAFTMASYAGSEMIGNYYVSTYFATIITFITIPVTTALFPTFSKMNPQKDPELVKTVFASSVKYTTLLLIPITFLLITLSTPLINTLFPKVGLLAGMFVVNAASKYPNAPLFLSLSILVNLFALAGNASMSSFLNGVGKTQQVMKQNLLCLAVGLPIAYLMVAFFYSIGGPLYAVIGGLIGLLISNVPNTAWGLYWIWKNYKIKADFNNSAKILGSSIIATAVSCLFLTFLSLPYFAILIVGFLVFSLVYVVTAPFIGAINYVDIENLKTMTATLPLVSKILGLPLLLMQRICKTKRSCSN
ncbi:MAG TPA: oligosaccharide flippase family protein [Candidatus Acidoferrum sp.]|nr:oligosaccharide flippase family protein [Candidatus Acidoferrum sp.]